MSGEGSSYSLWKKEQPHQSRKYQALEKLAEHAVRAEYTKKVRESLREGLGEEPDEEDVEEFLQGVLKKIREDGTLNGLINDYVKKMPPK